jgi:hypothetical protein
MNWKKLVLGPLLYEGIKMLTADDSKKKGAEVVSSATFLYRRNSTRRKLISKLALQRSEEMSKEVNLIQGDFERIKSARELLKTLITPSSSNQNIQKVSNKLEKLMLKSSEYSNDDLIVGLLVTVNEKTGPEDGLSHDGTYSTKYDHWLINTRKKDF